MTGWPVGIGDGLRLLELRGVRHRHAVAALAERLLVVAGAALVDLLEGRHLLDEELALQVLLVLGRSVTGGLLGFLRLLLGLAARSSRGLLGLRLGDLRVVLLGRFGVALGEPSRRRLVARAASARRLGCGTACTRPGASAPASWLWHRKQPFIVMNWSCA